MAATHVTFRWLDILEKEFDKAFVDLDILIGKISPGVIVNTPDPSLPSLASSGREVTPVLRGCLQAVVTLYTALVSIKSPADIYVREGCVVSAWPGVMMRHVSVTVAEGW